MSETPFNLNWIVRFKMTPAGLPLWDKYYSAAGLETPPVQPEMAMQLWELMQIFGPGMAMGLEPPIETEIVLMLPATARTPRTPSSQSPA